MPIADRPQFVAGALACFASQDYPNRELVVIDNGEQDLGRMFRGVTGVRYIRVDPGPKIGALRNMACDAAEGYYIAHWDSDDWYGPSRLSEQFRALRQSERPATGYNVLPFADDTRRRAWLYRGSEGYACGTSLMYVRGYWRGHKFAPFVAYGEDNDFIRRMEGRLLSMSGTSIVARVHGAGTSPRDLIGWPEIDYAGLAAVGYPVRLTDESIPEAGSTEPEDNRSRGIQDCRRTPVFVGESSHDITGALDEPGGIRTGNHAHQRAERYPLGGRRKRRDQGE